MAKRLDNERRRLLFKKVYPLLAFAATLLLLMLFLVGTVLASSTGITIHNVPNNKVEDGTWTGIYLYGVAPSPYGVGSIMLEVPNAMGNKNFAYRKIGEALFKPIAITQTEKKDKYVSEPIPDTGCRDIELVQYDENQSCVAYKRYAFIPGVNYEHPDPDQSNSLGDPFIKDTIPKVNVYVPETTIRLRTLLTQKDASVLTQEQQKTTQGFLMIYNTKTGRGGQVHTGMDFGGGAVPVYAPISGKVIADGKLEDGTDETYNTISIYNEEYNLSALILHCSEVDDEISIGSTVVKGETVIGTSGNKGLGKSNKTDAVHIHIEVRDGSETVGSRTPVSEREKKDGIYEIGDVPIRKTHYDPRIVLSIPKDGKFVPASEFRPENELVNTGAKGEHLANSNRAIIEIQPGSIVTFGTYIPMRLDKEEPLQWIVLEVKDDAALLLSRYIVRSLPHWFYDGTVSVKDADPIATKWEYSVIRNWLNTAEEVAIGRDSTALGFKTFFTQSEWDAIRVTPIDDGDTLADKAFLLSTDDVQNPAYFADDTSRKVTAYPGEYTSSNKPSGYHGNYNYGNCDWWLRTNNQEKEGTVHQIMYHGGVGYGRPTQINNNIGVRPAIWLPLLTWEAGLAVTVTD